MTPSQCYVFVVCGERPYIDSLNTAIGFLQRNTRSGIAVITDSRRNAAEIRCERVIDVPTNPDLNHHQASVFLKTSLHRYLDPEGVRYCYLDSDVLAISHDADQVFNQAGGPIIFGADNMTLDLFSPYAAQCGCLERAREDEAGLQKAQQAYAEKLRAWNEFNRQSGGDVLIEKLAALRRDKVRNFLPLLRFGLLRALPFSSKVSLLGYSYDKQQGVWLDAKGSKILEPINDYYDAVGRATGFRFDHRLQCWHRGDHHDVCIPRCTHLHDLIRDDYKIRIHPATWQHWNGGVFVFDQRSVAFLEHWHAETLRVFKDPRWRTRDQGTLAATVWKFGLQSAPVLNKRFNYIVDDHKPGLDLDADKGFTRDHGRSWDHPDLVHVYHRFGDESWPLWQRLMKLYGEDRP